MHPEDFNHLLKNTTNDAGEHDPGVYHDKSSICSSSEMSSSITLTHPEDWEPWLAQLRAVADTEIWPHIDPDTPAPEEGLLEKPN